MIIPKLYFDFDFILDSPHRDIQKIANTEKPPCDRIAVRFCQPLPLVGTPSAAQLHDAHPLGHLNNTAPSAWRKESPGAAPRSGGKAEDPLVSVFATSTSCSSIGGARRHAVNPLGATTRSRVEWTRPVDFPFTVSTSSGGGVGRRVRKGDARGAPREGSIVLGYLGPRLRNATNSTAHREGRGFPRLKLRVIPNLSSRNFKALKANPVPMGRRMYTALENKTVDVQEKIPQRILSNKSTRAKYVSPPPHLHARTSSSSAEHLGLPFCEEQNMRGRFPRTRLPSRPDQARRGHALDELNQGRQFNEIAPAETPACGPQQPVVVKSRRIERLAYSSHQELRASAGQIPPENLMAAIER